MKRLITLTCAALLLGGLAHGALAQTSQKALDAYTKRDKAIYDEEQTHRNKELEKKISQGTVKAANTVARGTVKAANIVGRGTVSTANTVGRGTVKAANTVGRGTVKAANTVAQGTKKAASKIKKFFKGL